MKMITKNEGNRTCLRCINLKCRVVTKDNLKNISKRAFQKAIKEQDYQGLNLSFPLTNGLYRKINKLGECRIVYCRAGLFRRKAYEYKDSFENGSVIKKGKICRQYYK